MSECPECHGAGTKKCPYCREGVVYDPRDPLVVPQTCPWCRGKKSIPCDECGDRNEEKHHKEKIT